MGHIIIHITHTCTIMGYLLNLVERCSFLKFSVIHWLNFFVLIDWNTFDRNDLKELCFLFGMQSNILLLSSSSTTNFKSPASDLVVCLPETQLTPVTLSKLLNVFEITPTTFPILTIAPGVLLAPRWATASLHTLFKCSM